MGARFLTSIFVFVGFFLVLMPAACIDPGLDPSWFLERCETLLGTPAPSWIDLVGTSTVDTPVISLGLAVVAAVAAWFLVAWIQGQMDSES